MHPAVPKPLDPRDWRPLPGFERINRYWDRVNQVISAKLLPGEYYVTQRAEMITTVLGSCISACVRDRVTLVGGMNHFMLPNYVEGAAGSWEVTDVNSATRYGNFAMEHLINDTLKAGARRENLEVKLFGGGRVLRLDLDVADRNVEFAIAYVEAERLAIVSRDLGGSCPRKVNYYPATGKAFVKRLTHMNNDTLERRERKYLGEIRRQPAAGEIEFF